MGQLERSIGARAFAFVMRTRLARLNFWVSIPRKQNVCFPCGCDFGWVFFWAAFPASPSELERRVDERTEELAHAKEQLLRNACSPLRTARICNRNPRCFHI